MLEESVLSRMQNLCPDKGKILVCVSGGIDSIVLLDILYSGGWDISVAHCNFSLRGEESDGDETFVREICKKHGILCHVKKFDTAGYAASHGLNTQIAARELRYNYFEELRIEHGYNYIAIAHHLDDDIETFFINLLRGTGLRGLSGISESRNAIVRPMLQTTREEISEYAKRKGLCHREDRTNSEDHYLRNRIRHHIIPALSELSPSFRKTMAENINNLAAARRYAENCLASQRNKIEASPGVFSLMALRENNQRSYLLFELLHPLGFNSDVIGQLDKAIEDNVCGKWFLGSTHRALLEKEQIRILPKKECLDFEEQTISSLNTTDIGAAGDYHHAPADMAYIDADKLTLPLTIRKWKAGDRISPLGMKGSKTVGDFLTDRRVSLAERDCIKVVVDGNGEIIWIVGMQISDRFKIDSNTKKVAIL